MVGTLSTMPGWLSRHAFRTASATGGVPDGIPDLAGVDGRGLELHTCLRGIGWGHVSDNF